MKVAKIAFTVALLLSICVATAGQQTNVRVLLFLRTDCPISKRYAPELQRIAQEFHYKPVEFWQVYVDKTESAEEIQKTIEEYHFPGKVMRDSDGSLVRQAHATVAPEAAVFDRSGRLQYHGRIDDRYVDFGKARPSATVHDLEDAITAVLAGTKISRPETRAIGCSLADAS